MTIDADRLELTSPAENRHTFDLLLDLPVSNLHLTDILIDCARSSSKDCSCHQVTDSNSAYGLSDRMQLPSDGRPMLVESTSGMMM